MMMRPPSNQIPPHGHSFPGSPMPPNGGAPPYFQPSSSPQMNHHHHQQHPTPPPPQHQQINNRGPPMMQPSGPIMTGGPPPQVPHHPPSGYMPPHPGVHHPGPERGSPFYHHQQHIPQSEFKIIELNKRLQNRPRHRGPSDPLPKPGSSDESNWWEQFACDFFDDEATLTIRIVGEMKPIEYSIGRPLIPRFFKSYFDGGVTDLSIKLRNIREMQHPHSASLAVTLECGQADIVTKNICRHPTNAIMYVVVHTEGHLSLDFVSNSFQNLVIKSWRFQAEHCHEYIDRTMTVSNTYSLEPVTRFGLTKSTVAYLKMCMIMEPMKDLMIYYRQTNGTMEPRSCLRYLLVEHYKVKDIDDNRAQPNKRRKRKTPATTGAATNKKSKANANIINGVADVSMGLPNMPLASRDVLTVGEPSMLGDDFGDENERRITRLENNQYDSSIDQSSQQSNIASDSNDMNQSQNRMTANNEEPVAPYQTNNIMNQSQNLMTANNEEPVAPYQTNNIMNQNLNPQKMEKDEISA